MINKSIENQIVHGICDRLFAPEELQAMHRYCLRYRHLVRAGGTPTKEQDDKFMRYQSVCYAEGIARG